MSTSIRPVLFLGLPLTAAPAFSQQQPSAPAPNPEEGRPFIRAYAPSELGGAGQNWAMVQDRRGVVYVGSQSGVLEFDGANWRLIETPTLDTVRSLAIDDSGRIHVGAVGDSGYLAPDASGELHYVSLLDRVPKEARTFSDVWRTFATPQGVYFQTEEYVFRWADDAIRVIRPVSRFYRSSLLDGRLYLAMPESGLNVLEGDTFRLLPGTAALAREVYPVILRYDDKRLLIGTRRNGLFLYNGATLVPFPTEVDAVIKANSLYRGVRLANGTIGLATTGSGLAIIDRQGHRVTVLDEAHGLPSNSLYCLMVDREGALWSATERGIARIETPSPVSFFDRNDGYLGGFDVTRHDGRLYFAEQSGVSYLHDATPGDPSRISRIPGLVNQCWSFEEVKDPAGRRPAAFVVACSDGLYEIQGTKAVPIRATTDDSYRSSVLLTSKVDPTRLWVGLFDGLASFRWVDGHWIDEGRVEPTRDAGAHAGGKRGRRAVGRNFLDGIAPRAACGTAGTWRLAASRVNRSLRPGAGAARGRGGGRHRRRHAVLPAVGGQGHAERHAVRRRVRDVHARHGSRGAAVRPVSRRVRPGEGARRHDVREFRPRHDGADEGA